MSRHHRGRSARVLLAALLAAASGSALVGAAALAASAAPSMGPMASSATEPGAQASGAAVTVVRPGDAGFVAGTVEAPRHVALEVNDELLFQPNVLPIVEGETITFDVTNVGTAVHEFKVGPTADVVADSEAAPEIADITAGSTKSLTYTFEGAGPFAFVCHEPGHFEHGMVGYVIVEGPDVPAVGTAEAPRLVWMTMDDKLQFVPSELTVAPGETIEFVLQNIGTAVHEFQVGDADLVAADTVDGVKVVEVDGIDPGHVATVTYTFAPGGTYAFACHEPGHYEAGMHGTITVSG